MADAPLRSRATLQIWGRYDTRRMPLNTVNAKSDASDNVICFPRHRRCALELRRAIPRTTSYRGASPDRVITDARVLVCGRLVRFNDRTGAVRPQPRHGPPVRPR